MGRTATQQRRGRAAHVVAVVLLAAVLTACDAAAEPEDAPAGDTTGDTAGDTAGAPGGGAAEAGGRISLAFAGDVHFEGGLAGVPQRAGSTLGPMSSTLREADLAVVNLESALTRRRDPAPKELEDPSLRYWFRSSPRALDVLARSGVDAVSVANNHGADHGLGGIRDTLRAAADAPVAVLGVGADPAQAFTPLVRDVRGTEVAVLAADASPRESADATWEIGPGTGPGLAAARDPEQLLTAVRAAAEQSDVVAVYLHWGEEGDECPTGRQESLAAQLSEAGADVVVGTHAHVPLGAGVHPDGSGSTYVSYGLGNFFWYHGNQPDTGVLRLEVEGGEVVADTWVPGRIRPDGGNAQPLTGRAARDAVARWEGLRACTDLQPGPAAAAATEDDGLPAFETTSRQIGPGLRAQMVGTSFRRGCPVPLADLRHVAVTHLGFDGAAHRGVIVVAADVVDDVQELFGALYAARFPIERMQLVDDFGGDDDASMAANNTSGFNCRPVAGSTSWSSHAYGRAVDLNPVQNPYVIGDRVLPPAGREFLDVDRSRGADAAPGVVVRGDAAHGLLTQLGWEWGGDYTEPDYQHFSLP